MVSVYMFSVSLFGLQIIIGLQFAFCVLWMDGLTQGCDYIQIMHRRRSYKIDLGREKQNKFINGEQQKEQQIWLQIMFPPKWLIPSQPVLGGWESLCKKKTWTKHILGRADCRECFFRRNLEDGLFGDMFCLFCFHNITQNNDSSSLSLGTFFPPLNYDKTHRSRLQMERSKLCQRWVGDSSSKVLAWNRVENKWNSHHKYSPYIIIWVAIIS